MKGKDSDNRKGMPQDLLPWKNLLKWSDILSRTRDDMEPMVWIKKVYTYWQNMHSLTINH